MQSRTFIRSGPPAFCRGGRLAHHGHHGHHGHGGARGAHFFPPGPFHHRGPPGFFNPGEFMPLLRLLDDVASPFNGGFPARDTMQRGNEFWPWGQFNVVRTESFNPSFDVKETDTAYELRGELPGVAPENIEVAFTDAQTLVIKGHTEREVTNGQPDQLNSSSEVAQADQPTNSTQEQPSDNADEVASDAGSTFSTSSYQKPSVEDEEPAQQTPETSTATEAALAATDNNNSNTVAEQQPQETKRQTERYWYSERSTGSFERTFNFPARVDQDGVTASLRNGILELSVPKAQNQTRRISVL